MPRNKRKTRYQSTRHIQRLFCEKNNRGKPDVSRLLYNSTDTPITSIHRISTPQDPTIAYIENKLIANFIPTGFAAPCGMTLLGLSALMHYLDANHYLYPTISLFSLHVQASLGVQFVVYLLKARTHFKETMKRQFVAISIVLRENNYSPQDTKGLLKLYMLSCEALISTQESKDYSNYINYINLLTHSLTLIGSIEKLYSTLYSKESINLLSIATDSYSFTGIVILAGIFSSARHAQKIQRQIHSLLDESYARLIQDKPEQILKPFKKFEKERKAHASAHSICITRELISNLALSFLILTPSSSLRSFTKGGIVFGLYVYNHWKDGNQKSQIIDQSLSPHYRR